MKNEIKRHFYNNRDYIVDKETQTVSLMPAFYDKLKNKKLWEKFGFKKIGGSSIGDVLEVDQFKSQFAAFCRMCWIGIPVLDRKYVDAGIAIEPKVIAAIEEKSHKKVATFNPQQYNFDFFAQEDHVVGGIPDGYIASENIVIEIKTTNIKNLQKWNTYGIPAGYLKQAQLYAYLMKADKYAIVAAFLQEEDYLQPENYPIKSRIIKSWKFKTNLHEAKDDIQKVKDWYYHFTNGPASPKWDDKRDADLLEWLTISNATEWEQLKQKWIKLGKLVP